MTDKEIQSDGWSQYPVDNPRYFYIFWLCTQRHRLWWWIIGKKEPLFFGNNNPYSHMDRYFIKGRKERLNHRLLDNRSEGLFQKF